MLTWLKCLGVMTLAIVLPSAPAAAQQTAAQTIKLWPATPPGLAISKVPEKIGSDGIESGAYSSIADARMEVYRPKRSNGTAVLIIGGGGYFSIQIGTAARPTARWLAERGVTAFVLFYRLPGDGHLPVAPFQDGQRALRLIRANASKYGYHPQKVGVIGFSAGGNLAGILATRSEENFYPPRDVTDRTASRPNFAALLYPVISLAPPLNTTRTAKWLGSQADAVAAYSVEKHVNAQTPPIFLVHAMDDTIADPRHTLWMTEAMRAAKRPVATHLVTTGGHSWALGKSGTEVGAWPQLFAEWATARGFPISNARQR